MITEEQAARMTEREAYPLDLPAGIFNR